MSAGGRAFDYLHLLLLQDQQTEQAFHDLQMKAVSFLPKIIIDGTPVDGKDFFSRVNDILKQQIALEELLTQIPYSHPTFSILLIKSEGLFSLLALQNIMEITSRHGSKAQAMKRGVEYLVYQYASTTSNPFSLDTITSYIRSQRYLSATTPLRKLTIRESRSVVNDSIAHLEQMKLVSLSTSGEVLNNFGVRPEEFLRIDRPKIRNDFGF